MHRVLNMFIFTRTLVTYARTIFKPRCCLNFQSMRTQAESTYIAHNMFGQIKMKIPWYNSRHTLILEKEVYFYQMLVILHKGSTYCTFKIIPRANIVFCPAG